MNVNYGLNSFIRDEAVSAQMHTFDLNPRVSYQINPNVAVGVGLDALDFTNGELTSRVFLPGEPLFTAIGGMHSWAFGWDAGIFATLHKGTYASLAFFSPITEQNKGYSALALQEDSLFNPNARVQLKFVPATLVLRLTQFLTSNWWVQFMGAFDEASAEKQLLIQNLATEPQYVKAANLNNSFMLSLETQYQFNYWSAFLVGGSFEEGVFPIQTNEINMPGGHQWAVFGGPVLNITKIVSLQLLYTHVWANSNLNYNVVSLFPNQGEENGFTPLRIVGRTHTNENLVELKLSFKA